ncbi:MAG: phosphorylase [Gammaproteobacteria bacterium]|nr:phosphorylase [Gammaproteobacteria bacterium]
MLTADSFWDAVRHCAREALGAGALQPISTRASIVEDDGLRFIVRISDNLRRKQQAGGSYRQPHRGNPFLPPDPALTVGALPPGHVAVLNKFNVLDNHVLVVTNHFVHQESPLAAADFAAAAVGLAQGGALAFYNGGRTAGASQPHRHFQLVPLPLGSGADFPTAGLFEDAADGIDGVERLHFHHVFRRLAADPGDPDAFGRACLGAYQKGLSALGLAGAAGLPSRLAAYNLLLTRDWLFIVPRSRELFADISVNGLGYAGSLFVSTPEKLQRVGSTGPMRILEKVSKPRR